MFYVYLVLIILIPFFLKNKISLFFSFVLIFILWGLEYRMVQDWDGNIARWYGCFQYQGMNVADKGAGGKTLEPFYVIICRWHETIGYFGQLITTALLGICVFYYLICKYVTPKYYWLSLFIFFIRPENALLIFNSNRQSIALLLTLVAVFVLLKNYYSDVKSDIVKLLISFVFIKLATLVHTGAIFAYVIPILYLLAKYVNLTKYNLLLIVCNILFLSRFSYSLSYIADDLLKSDLIGFINEYYLAYTRNLDTTEKEYSIFETILYFIPMNYAIISLDKMKGEFRFLSLVFVLAMILTGFFVSNLARVIQYYHIYMIVLIPYLCQLVMEIYWKKYKFFIIIIFPYMILYSIYAFVVAMQGYLYCRWQDFQTTIFDAPVWM